MSLPTPWAAGMKRASQGTSRYLNWSVPIDGFTSTTPSIFSDWAIRNANAPPIDNPHTTWTRLRWASQSRAAGSTEYQSWWVVRFICCQLVP